MPNHCSHVMTVTGSEEGIARFKRNVIKPISEEDRKNKPWVPENEFDFNAIIPMPECLVETRSPAVTDDDIQRWSANSTEEHIAELQAEKAKNDKAREECGFDNWYDWCCANWGTKWGAYDLHVGEDFPDRLGLNYDTAWCPANESFMQEMASQYPELHFEIYAIDEGMGFACHIEMSDGMLVHYSEHEYESSRFKWIAENIFKIYPYEEEV